MNNANPTTFNGITINVNKDSMINMTDLWKASGKSKNYQPFEWIRKEGADFIAVVEYTECKTASQSVLRTTRGRNGGTFAHWQIALAYAKYLSPELHMYVNEVFRERQEEIADPTLSISRGRQRAIETWQRQGRSDTWIEQRISSIESTKRLNTVLIGRGNGRKIHSLVADELNKGIVGMTAKGYRTSNGISKSSRIRETMTDEENAAFSFASLATARVIREQGIRGNSQCKSIAGSIASSIAKIIKG